MTGIAIRVDARQLIAAAEDLAEKLEKAEHRRDMLEDIGAALTASTVGRFERGIDPEGRPWQPSQRALAEGGLTLVDRGHLKGSQHYVVADPVVSIGSDLVYAAIHQESGQAGRNLATRLPARPYLGVSPSDRRAIEDIVSDHLAEAFR